MAGFPRQTTTSGDLVKKNADVAQKCALGSDGKCGFCQRTGYPILPLRYPCSWMVRVNLIRCRLYSSFLCIISGQTKGRCVGLAILQPRWISFRARCSGHNCRSFDKGLYFWWDARSRTIRLGDCLSFWRTFFSMDGNECRIHCGRDVGRSLLLREEYFRERHLVLFTDR